ncbi:hypothetical protein HFC70_01260 [Agrobacterium sp. a22-2]|nr:hypothetical protein [Agrobacterium sp. a22-2]NKN34975.1 hypothetical protein [Agrobacterium sp. a22-2]
MSITFETPPRRAPFSRPVHSTWTVSLHRTAQVVIVVAAYMFVTVVLFVF